jgi:hypothetical protein
MSWNEHPKTVGTSTTLSPIERRDLTRFQAHQAAQIVTLLPICDGFLTPLMHPVIPVHTNVSLYGEFTYAVHRYTGFFVSEDESSMGEVFSYNPAVGLAWMSSFSPLVDLEPDQMVYFAEGTLAANMAIIHSPSSQLRIQKAYDYLCLCGTVGSQDLLEFIQELPHLLLLGLNEQNIPVLIGILPDMKSEEIESLTDVGDSRLLLRKLYTDSIFQMLGNFPSETFGFRTGLTDGKPVVRIARDRVQAMGNILTVLPSLAFPAEAFLAEGVQSG